MQLESQPCVSGGSETPPKLKEYFDRVWLPGVAFDVTSEGDVSTERLKQLRRIMVVTTYGGPWWMVRFAISNPARKVIGRAVRALCARNCRVTWCVHYNMDKAVPAQLARFLQRIPQPRWHWPELPGTVTEIDATMAYTEAEKARAAPFGCRRLRGLWRLGQSLASG